MADDSKPSDSPEPLELVAVERGFYRGAMVEVGTKFPFYGTKPPKWAVRPGDQRGALDKAKKPLAFDTKPAAAAAAVKAKAAGLSGSSAA